MTVSHNLCSVALFFCLFSVHIHAQLTVLSKPGDTVHVEAGKTLSLVVKFRYKGSVNLRATWYFNLSNRRSFKEYGKDIEDQTNLTISNASLNNSGTYSLRWSGSWDRNDDSFVVVVQIRPIAELKCQNKPDPLVVGGNVSCNCEGKNGVPAASVKWIKSNKQVGAGRTFEIIDVRKRDGGELICKVQSGTLSDEAKINIDVNYPPDELVFAIEPSNSVPPETEVIFTCKAGANPKPTYRIRFNGSDLSGVVGGILTKKVQSSDTGDYVCHANNTVGENYKTIYLNVTGEITPTKPVTSTPVGTSGGSGTGESEGGLGAGAVAGIVIGVLFLLVVVILLIWWFYFRDVGHKEQRGDRQAPGPAEPRNETAYDSVEKDDEPASSRNPPAPAPSASSASPSSPSDLPPVYASVDRNKKTKKPPPSSPPTSVQYASLDPVALQPDSSRMRVRETNDTQYAAIDLEKLQSDLV